MTRDATAMPPPGPGSAETRREPPPEGGPDERLGTLGRYQLLALLAEGGMGRVYVGRLAAAHGVQRLVAIKVLHRVPSPATRSALLREARVTARLHHRNVVPTLELDEHDNAPFVVMELVDGASLAELLGAVKEAACRLDVALAAWIVAQAATGLHAAHELRGDDGGPLGLVHRDVSPHNVLLAFDGRVQVADFGIAKLASSDDSTEIGVIKGKYAYMSPEQATAGPLDRRSDVFSLGVVLYEALTGERAFAGDSPPRVLLRVVNDEPAPASSLRAEIDAALSAILVRCLAKRPEERFATALDLAAALRAWSRTAEQAVDETTLAPWMERFLGSARRERDQRVQARVRALDAAARETAAPATHTKRSGTTAAALAAAVVVALVAWRSLTSGATALPVAETSGTASSSVSVSAPDGSAFVPVVPPHAELPARAPGIEAVDAGVPRATVRRDVPGVRSASSAKPGAVVHLPSTPASAATTAAPASSGKPFDSL